MSEATSLVSLLSKHSPALAMSLSHMGKINAFFKKAEMYFFLKSLQFEKLVLCFKDNSLACPHILKISLKSNLKLQV